MSSEPARQATGAATLVFDAILGVRLGSLVVMLRRRNRRFVAGGLAGNVGLVRGSQVLSVPAGAIVPFGELQGVGCPLLILAGLPELLAPARLLRRVGVRIPRALG